MTSENYNAPPFQFDEIEIIVRGADVKGKTVTFKVKHQLDENSCFHMSASRPTKRKKGQLRPSEFVFHNINFITTSKA